MPDYDVHIYRVMKLKVSGVSATSPEQAALNWRDRPVADFDSVDECDGETISALVDVVGDEEFLETKLFDWMEVKDANPKV